MNANNNNTATPASGVAAKSKEYIDFGISKVDKSYYEKAETIDTFPYVKTEGHEVLHFTYKEFDDKEFYYCQFLCSDFKIKEVYKSEKKGNVLFLTIKVFKDGKWWEHSEVPLSYFTSNNLHELKKYGITYNPYLKSHFEIYASMLIEYEEAIEKTDKLGWVGKSIKDISFFGFDTASYEGDTPLLCRGNFKKQVKAVNKCIKDSIGCQLAIAISLSSSLLVPLRLHSIAIDPVVYHFFGSSSTGKTTALKLAASMWTNPLEKGLMNSWNSTGNGLMALLNNNFGATVCFDEIGMSTINLTDFIYSLSQGSDKTRCSPNGILPTKTWCTNLMSTGEISFSSKVNKQGGMSARIIEFMDLPITNSEKHSKDIQAVYTKFYGCIGKEFVKVLPGFFPQFAEDFNKKKDSIVSKLPSGNISRRLSLQYACVCLAAEYAQAIGVLVDPDKVEEYLINNHKDVRSSCEIAYCYIMDYLKQKQQYFPKEISEYDGTVKGYFKNNKLVIFKDIFEDMLRWINLDPKLIIKEFDSRGLLEHEKDRLSKRVLIGSSKHTMYVIKTDYDFDGEEAKSLDTVLKGSEVSLAPVKASITGQRRKLKEDISA